MIKLLRHFNLLGFLLLGLVPIASAAPCSVYTSSSLYGTTPGYSTTVAVAPFTVNCDGAFSGSLQRLTSGVSLVIQLEKQTTSGWLVVDEAYIAYSGTAGTYRYTVKNNSAASGDWSVSYRRPLY